MKTLLHHYSFDVSKPDEKAAYEAMVARINANGIEGRGHWMHAIGGNKSGDGNAGTTEEVEIETAHIYDNQWNTTDRRVFDWYEEAIYNNGRENRTRKRGHWLEITAEMTAARMDAKKCGYCGHTYGPLHEMPVPENGFCIKCLDSAYLKEGELHLLRLLPLVGLQKREKLTDGESADLLPKYVSRQTTGHESRSKQKRDKQRDDVLEKFSKDTSDAITERDGMLWLWDRGFLLDNVILYSHTQKFCFGWRTGVSPSVESKLLDVMSEFPFTYEIKCADGRVLENYVEA